MSTKAEIQAEYKARNMAKAAVDPSLVPHGTLGGFTNWGCSCERCASIFYKYQKRTNDISRRTARKHYQPYTSEELEMILDTNFKPRELSVILGRTIQAIRAARYKYRKASAGA